MSEHQAAAMAPGQAAPAVTYIWDYRQQPPMDAIISHVTGLAGGTVTIELTEDGDEYKMIIAGRLQPAPVTMAPDADVQPAAELAGPRPASMLQPVTFDDSADESELRHLVPAPGLAALVRDMLQAFPDTADEQEWRDRAGALGICGPDGKPYRAYTEEDL